MYILIVVLHSVLIWAYSSFADIPVPRAWYWISSIAGIMSFTFALPIFAIPHDLILPITDSMLFKLSLAIDFPAHLLSLILFLQCIFSFRSPFAFLLATPYFATPSAFRLYVQFYIYNLVFSSRDPIMQNISPIEDAIAMDSYVEIDGPLSLAYVSLKESSVDPPILPNSIDQSSLICTPDSQRVSIQCMSNIFAAFT